MEAAKAQNWAVVPHERKKKHIINYIIILAANLQSIVLTLTPYLKEQSTTEIRFVHIHHFPTTKLTSSLCNLASTASEMEPLELTGQGCDSVLRGQVYRISQEAVID
jgi:hypothetical protein